MSNKHPQRVTGRRAYLRPAIVHEVALETRAGTPDMYEDPLLLESMAAPARWLGFLRPPRA